MGSFGKILMSSSQCSYFIASLGGSRPLSSLVSRIMAGPESSISFEDGFGNIMIWIDLLRECREELGVGIYHQVRDLGVRQRKS